MSELERLTDDALMMRYKNDDDEPAFDVLYLRYAGGFNDQGKRVASPAMRFLTFNVGDVDDAETIHSQCWEKIYKAKGRYESGNFRAYFYTVMTHAVIDFWRQQGRSLEDPMDSEVRIPNPRTIPKSDSDSISSEGLTSGKGREEDYNKRATRAPLEESTPEETAFWRECVEYLRKAFPVLPDGQRLCLLYRLETNLTYGGIARELDIDVEAIKSRLRYGKDKLKLQIPAECIEGL